MIHLVSSYCGPGVERIANSGLVNALDEAKSPGGDAAVVLGARPCLISDTKEQTMNGLFFFLKTRAISYGTVW